jgi:hypothetical protein
MTPLSTLWWCADNIAEAQAWKQEYEGKGAYVTIAPPNQWGAQIDVLISLERKDAMQVLGYQPDEEEWLIGDGA